MFIHTLYIYICIYICICTRILHRTSVPVKLGTQYAGAERWPSSCCPNVPKDPSHSRNLKISWLAVLTVSIPTCSILHSPVPTED